MDDKVALKVENISKSFKLPNERHSSLKQTILNIHRRKFTKLKVLKNLSFEVRKGEFFGVVGRNGSGKSTLLKLIAGIYQPSLGNIKINGRLTPFIELGVGFNMELSGRDNIFLNGAILGLTKKEVQQKYDEIVQFAELEKFMDQKLKNYSSGMMVRLAFSIAIQAHADILLVDEVFAVGDENFQRKCFDIFDQIKKQGRTVIFVTYDMSSVQRFCDRGLLIHNGRIKLIGSPIDVAHGYHELNLEESTNQDQKPEKPKNYSIEVSIVKHDPQAHQLRFKIKYKNRQKAGVYVGFSIIKDGVTVAELTSYDIKSKATGDELEYLLDTSGFNPGYYEISAGLMQRKNKQLLLATDKRAKFNIKGYDPKRSGAIFLSDNWVEK